MKGYDTEIVGVVEHLTCLVILKMSHCSTESTYLWFPEGCNCHKGIWVLIESRLIFEAITGILVRG